MSVVLNNLSNTLSDSGLAPRMLLNNVLFVGGMQTAFATILGGASLGTAIVTIGLPAGAVAITASLLNVISLKVLQKMEIIQCQTTSFPRNSIYFPDVHIGIESCRRTFVVVTLAGLTFFFPIFRINFLFTLVIDQLPLISNAICSASMRTSILSSTPFLPWMDRLGVFVRA